MSRILSTLKRWSFALLMMGLIYFFSSIPSEEMPDFMWADILVKKTGHAVVYSLLALSFWYGLHWKLDRLWLAWLLSFLYALLDEVHQSFVPGRNAWWVDVVIDSAAAALALWIASRWREKKKNKSG